MPKMLRPYFRYDRTLLGELCRISASVITESIRYLLGDTSLDVGVVACVHTFGNSVNELLTPFFVCYALFRSGDAHNN